MSACEYWEELISAEADGEITAEERAALAAHLEQCEHCRRYRAAVAAVSAALTEEQAEPPETLSFAVMTKLAMQEALERERKHPRRFTPRRVAGLAASLLIIAGLGVAGSRFLSRSGDTAASAPQAMSVKDGAPAAGETGGMTLFSAPAAAEEKAVEEPAAETAEAEGIKNAASGNASFSMSAAAAAAEDAVMQRDTDLGTQAAEAARAYVLREMPEELDSVLDLDAPLVEKLSGMYADYLPVQEDYQPQGVCCAVTFSTRADAILGPIVVLVDENGTVYGVLPRE